MAKWNLDDLVSSNDKITKLRKHVHAKIKELNGFIETQQKNGVWIGTNVYQELVIYEKIWKMIT